MKKKKTAENTTSLAPVISIFLCTIAYMVTGYMTLEPDSRHVPLLAGYVTIFLLFFETLKRFVPRAMVQDDQEQACDEEIDVTLLRELTGLLYVFGFALGIYFLGFYLALPLYIFLAITFLGSQAARSAVFVSAIASVVIYIVFELLLETRLHEGLLFS